MIEVMERIASALERLADSHAKQAENAQKLVDERKNAPFEKRLQEEYKEAVAQNYQFRTVIEILRQKLADKGMTDE